jgi:hypothetical protein
MIESKLIKIFIIITLLPALVACQAAPILNITSSESALIEKNGIGICSSGPSASCKVTGSYHIGPFGECVGGANTRLEAFPIDPKAGFKQSKTVAAYCGQNLSVFFDMNSGGVINTIEHNPEVYNLPSHSISEKLELLQSLKKKGLISSDDYKAKKAEVLNSIR